VSEKCHVVVCTGTACYVMGGAEILALEDRLPEALRGRVVLEGATCLGLCREGAMGGPPFVRIDGEVLCEATLERVVAKVESSLGPEAGA
jgi:NADH:ubiquinone oxidoreductase subunit E